jgi:hypothetical protein
MTTPSRASLITRRAIEVGLVSNMAANSRMLADVQRISSRIILGVTF